MGRAYAYGLGAAGGEGVARAIEILCSDFVRTMKLLGCPSVKALDPSYLDVPADWLVEARPHHTVV
jgi:L-lactate dehydrogenase (cytochrome)